VFKAESDGLLWMLGIMRKVLKLFDILILQFISTQRQCKLTQGGCALTQSGAQIDAGQRTDLVKHHFWKKWWFCMIHIHLGNIEGKATYLWSWRLNLGKVFVAGQKC
jgi:hypothetical protein